MSAEASALARWAGCAALGFALALLGAPPVNADVAVVYASSGAPAAAGAQADALGLATTDLDGAVPVRMDYERVEIDLYPTLVTVDASFEMHAEADTEDLLVAFPELLGGALISKPLLGLRVEVDGQPVALEQGARAQAVCTKLQRDEAMWTTESWWAWPMRAEAGRDYVIRVRYAQLLNPFDEDRVNYVLRTGASWLGPIGRGDIELRLHDILREQVEVYWPELAGSTALEPAPVSDPPAPLSWSFERLEPDDDVLIVPQGVGHEPALDFAKVELPEEPIYELLIRVSLLPWRDPITEWTAIVALMDEVEREGEAGRRIVAQLRDEITHELVDRAARHGRLAFAPDDEHPRWAERSSSISAALVRELGGVVERFGGDMDSVEQALQRLGADEGERCAYPVVECVDDQPSIATAAEDLSCLPRPMRGLLWLPGNRGHYVGGGDPLYGLVALASREAEGRSRARSGVALALAGFALLGFGTTFALWRRRPRSSGPVVEGR